MVPCSGSRLAVLLVPVLLASACSGVGEAEVKAKQMNLELEWTLTVDHDRLRVDYTVHNKTASSVVLLDQLLVKDMPDPDAIIVKNGDAAKTVAFTRAWVRTNEKVLVTPFPVARSLAAGASAKGTAFVPLPLRAWHNYSKVPPLSGDATTAVLEIGYLEDPHTKLVDQKVAGGVVKRAVEMAKQKILRGAPLQLPKP